MEILGSPNKFCQKIFKTSRYNPLTWHLTQRISYPLNQLGNNSLTPWIHQGSFRLPWHRNHQNNSPTVARIHVGCMWEFFVIGPNLWSTTRGNNDLHPCWFASSLPLSALRRPQADQHMPPTGWQNKQRLEKLNWTVDLAYTREQMLDTLVNLQEYCVHFASERRTRKIDFNSFLVNGEGTIWNVIIQTS